VWVGARAVIFPGVTVGRDSVIGIGSIVTRDVPPRTLVAGSPARVVRTL
ncbi:MAG: sugar O-acetyltransferase, partial [Actinomycetota bacterium]